MDLFIAVRTPNRVQALIQNRAFRDWPLVVVRFLHIGHIAVELKSVQESDKIVQLRASDTGKGRHPRLERPW